MKTIIVNCLAGPGAGKTTAAWEIASELKKRGIVTEYVSEYAKELVWDNKLDLLDGSIKNQELLLKEQNRRLQRLVGKVSVVVTDSPLLLNYQYLKAPTQDYKANVLETFGSYNNFNIFIKRGADFEKEGRIHDLKESLAIDKKIQRFLRENEIFFGTYSQNTVALICDNIEHSLVNNTRYKERSDALDIDKKKQNIKVEGHIGTWYEVDNKQYGKNTFYLMEHEEYGDEAPAIIIDENNELVLDEVYNGFDDLDDLDYFVENEKSGLGSNNTLYEEINQNYKIIEVATVGSNTFVIGENLDAPSPYVIWDRYTDRKDNSLWRYENGRYVSTYEQAVAKFADVIKEEVDIIKLGANKSIEGYNAKLSKEQLQVVEIAINKGLSEKQIAVFAKKDYAPEKMEFIRDLFVHKDHKTYQLLKPYLATANLEVLMHLKECCTNWKEGEINFLVKKSPNIEFAREITKFINSGIKVNPYLKAGFTPDMLKDAFDILHNNKCSVETFNSIALDEGLSLEEKRESIHNENSFVIKKDEDNSNIRETMQLQQASEEYSHDDR